MLLLLTQIRAALKLHVPVPADNWIKNPHQINVIILNLDGVVNGSLGLGDMEIRGGDCLLVIMLPKTKIKF